MKVLDLPLNENVLAMYKGNAFYEDNHEALTEDFNRLYADYLNIEMPDAVTDQQKAGASSQKTDLFVSFVTGHLNFLDLNSSLAKKINGKIDKSRSGLILPDHLVK